MSFIQNSMLFQALDQGIENLLGAASGILETTVKAAPGAIGAVGAAASEAVSGINTAVTDFSTSVSAAAPSAPDFASMCAGFNFSGLGACTVAPAAHEVSMESLGDMSAQLSNKNMQREASGFSMSA